MNKQTDWRAWALAGLHALARGTADGSLAPDVAWHVSSPIELLNGADAVEDGFFAPMRHAISRLRRRDLMVLGGTNRRAVGGEWIATICHYVGTFRAPLWGIAPHDRLVFLRAGEFYRVDQGRITEARIIVDVPDLLRQTGRLSVPHLLGAELAFPAPETQDAILPGGGHGARTLDLIERMISTLHVFDPKTFSSAEQTGDHGIWHPEMMWYGPGMIGSNTGWDGFVKDHRAPFLTAFPDRKGGNHYCRIGDGDYAAISGWPSMTMTHAGDYLDMPATGKALTLRVMDFYRCVNTAGGPGQIIENWVLLDLVDLFAQMGRDLIAEAAALP